MRRARALLLFCLGAAAPAAAQPVVTSAGPDAVAVTLYREPGRSAEDAFDLEWLEGYALISETRRIAIPAGESEVRFEGVAGGIQPQSAIVGGFPDVVERNRDAYLLSPGSLLDRSLGQRVHLRRTSRATGAVVEQDAVIRSGADGAVVLQTPDGFEALRCTGLSERLIYDRVPSGLSARPTLSVRVRAPSAVTATVTLSYLATGFDWQANYIASLSADGSRVDLFAWLTLASMDETSFVNAETQAVAGRLNREHVEHDDPDPQPLNITCWPQGRTHEFPVVVESQDMRLAGRVRTENLVGQRLQDVSEGAENIVVTAMRARQENLGDLKLYRIPERVTVAARSQKQVAFLEQNRVLARTVYRHRLEADEARDAEAATRYLVTRNRTQEGLGIPLPAGRIQLFASGAGRPILLGQGSLEDRAVGEDVEIALGEAPGVTSRTEETGYEDNWTDYLLTVTNDSALPVRYEAEFDVDDDQRFQPRGRLSRRDGRPLWTVTVPANGIATLAYRTIESE